MDTIYYFSVYAFVLTAVIVPAMFFVGAVLYIFKDLICSHISFCKDLK